MRRGFTLHLLTFSIFQNRKVLFYWRMLGLKGHFVRRHLQKTKIIVCICVSDFGCDSLSLSGCLSQERSEFPSCHSTKSVGSCVLQRTINTFLLFSTKNTYFHEERLFFFFEKPKETTWESSFFRSVAFLGLQAFSFDKFFSCTEQSWECIETEGSQLKIERVRHIKFD